VKTMNCIIIFTVVAFMAAGPATAAMSSPNYRIPISEFSSGGAALSSDNYQMDTILGQPSPLMVDNLPPSSASYKLYPGFWYILEMEPNSPIRALVREYYLDILDREPDQGGWDYWVSEIERIMSLGVYVGEGFQAEARFFFNTGEYTNKNKTNAQFVTDLYQAFLQREPDQGGLNYHVGRLSCLSRDMLITDFAYTPEFQQYMTNIFGPDTTRPENNLVNDFYRGLLNRFPDNDGFNYWRQQMRQAQCTSAAAVQQLSYTIALDFMQSPEYAARNRNNTQYVEDLYNGILRRAGDCDGFTFWINELNNGASRASVLESFTESPEFQTRVQAVIDAGCLP
jgi:hypothetical protein